MDSRKLLWRTSTPKSSLSDFQLWGNVKCTIWQIILNYPNNGLGLWCQNESFKLQSSPLPYILGIIQIQNRADLTIYTGRIYVCFLKYSNLEVFRFLLRWICLLQTYFSYFLPISNKKKTLFITWSVHFFEFWNNSSLFFQTSPLESVTKTLSWIRLLFWLSIGLKSKLSALPNYLASRNPSYQKLTVETLQYERNRTCWI